MIFPESTQGELANMRIFMMLFLPVLNLREHTELYAADCGSFEKARIRVTGVA